MSTDPTLPRAAGDPGDPTRTIALSGAAPGVEIGPYKLLRQIGEGGMGVVYHAVQVQPMRRDVALKIIKPGMDTRQVIARFEGERQALAVMDHPNISRVFEAGSTAAGLPYFAMELVDGMPITRYCDSKRLTVKQRIELLIPVCRAIQHAHQKGIIHRDLKPSNILVVEQEGKAFPKVIDFGLAKALGPQPADATLMTNLGTVVGTLDYMSPEQADPGRRDVDTRSDVYSLGAVLYELLTGTTPLERERLAKVGYVEALQRIRDDETPPPSARLRRSTTSAQIAAQRRSNPAQLPKLLHGELDWIAMKAVEKDRTRRYETVNGMARDLERYLAGEPVEAAPPSPVYRMRKFARRHMVALGFAGTVVMLLIVFAVAVTVQARRIARERDRANQQAETARQVSSFLTELFSVSNPNVARGNAVTARELLEQGSARIRGELQNQPAVRSTLLESMASAYDGLGLFPEARKLAEEGLDLRRSMFGQRSLETAAALRTLADIVSNQGDYGTAVNLNRQVLEIYRALLPRDDIRIAGELNNLGDDLALNQDYAQAIPLLRESLEMARKREGPDGPTTADATQRLGMTLVKERDYAGAEPLLREAIRIYEHREGENSSNLANTLNDLGNLLSMREDFAGAEAAYRRCREIAVKIFALSHPNIAILDENIAANLRRQKRYTEAEELMRDSTARFIKAVGDQHPRYSVFLDGLGDILMDKGDMAGAGVLYRHALEFDQARARRHLTTSYVRLGDWLARTGHPEQGEPLLRDGLEDLARSTPAGSPEMAEDQRLLGRCLTDLHRFPEAESFLLPSYEMFRKTFGDSHRQTRESAAALAALYDIWGRPADAARFKGAQ